MARPVRDHRPTLRISEDTWRRESQPHRIVVTATQMGHRLVVVRRDGEEWYPQDVPPERW